MKGDFCLPMQTYQSKYTGKQIEDAIDKISSLQTSIQNNANAITSSANDLNGKVNALKNKDTSIDGEITALKNRVQALEEKVDHYEFSDSDYNGLTSTVGIVIPIVPSEIENYNYFVVKYRIQNSQDNASFRMYYASASTISGETTYSYSCAGISGVLTLKYNSSTSMVARYIEGQ